MSSSNRLPQTVAHHSTSASRSSNSGGQTSGGQFQKKGPSPPGSSESTPNTGGEQYEYQDPQQAVPQASLSSNTAGQQQQGQFNRPSPGPPYTYGPPGGLTSQFAAYPAHNWQGGTAGPSRPFYEGNTGYPMPPSPRAGMASYMAPFGQVPGQIPGAAYGAMPLINDPAAMARYAPSTYTGSSPQLSSDYASSRRQTGMSAGGTDTFSTPRAVFGSTGAEPLSLSLREEDMSYIRSLPAYQQAIACRTVRDMSYLLFAVQEGLEYASNANNVTISNLRAPSDRIARSGFLNGVAFESSDDRTPHALIQMKGYQPKGREAWQTPGLKRKHASISESSYHRYGDSFALDPSHRPQGENFDAQGRPVDVSDPSAWHRGAMRPGTTLSGGSHLPGHSLASQRVISILDGITHEEISTRAAQSGDVLPQVTQPPPGFEGNELVEWWASKTTELIKAPSQRRAATKVTNKEYYLIWLYYLELREAVEKNAASLATVTEADTPSARLNQSHAVANTMLRRSHGNYSRNDDRILKKSRKVYQLGSIIGTSPGILVMSDELSGWRLFEWFGTMEEWEGFLARICSDSMGEWLTEVRAKLTV